MYRKVDSLSVSQVDKGRADRTCGGYYYLVMQGVTSWTAFRTKYGFLRWLNSRGLKLTEPLVPRGECHYQRIEGHFYEASMTVAEFQEYSEAKGGQPTLYKMENGDYLPSYIEHAEDGAVVIVFPWSGLGEHPKINHWEGCAIEEGNCYETRRVEAIPSWLLGKPKEVVSAAAQRSVDSLTLVEKAIIASHWLALDDSGHDVPPLHEGAIVKEMIFE